MEEGSPQNQEPEAREARVGQRPTASLVPGPLLTSEVALAKERARQQRLVQSLARSRRGQAGMTGLVAENRRAMRAALEPLRLMDGYASTPFRSFESAASATLARLATGPSLLATERLAQAADFTAQATIQKIRDAVIPSYIAQLRATSGLITSASSGILAAQRVHGPIERALAQTMTEWRQTARVTPPLQISAARLLDAGRATLDATLATEMILEPDPDHASHWRDAPHETRQHVRQRLAELDERLVRKLDGAWERISRPGPDAASQAAASAVELLDWALRLRAPDELVLRWHADTSDRPPDLDGSGGPRRPLRVRYLMASGDPRLASAAQNISSGVSKLLGILQKQKHGLGFDDTLTVRFLLLASEGVLAMLLL